MALVLKTDLGAEAKTGSSLMKALPANAWIMRDKPLHTAAMSTFPYSAGLEAAYTFRTSFGELTSMAVRRGNTLLVPRETAPISDEDWRVLKPRAAIDCKLTPRNPEQIPLAERSIELLLSGRNHIFDAPTGWGKSVVGSYIAARVGQPTLIVVTKQDLLDNWRAALTQVLGISPSLVGRIQADTCEWQGKQFVLGMAQSLMIPGRYPAEMYRHFGMLLCDEVHMMAADCFVRVCQTFPAKYRLGFSATEKRRDGKSKLLYAHIGPVLVKGNLVPMKPKVLIRETGWRIPLSKDGKGRIPHAPGRMSLVTKALAASDSRNREIVQFVPQAYEAGRNVLILSDLIEGHLQKLFRLLIGRGIPVSDMGYYIGGLDKQQLDKAKRCRVVLATYAMCSTGTDVPEWDSLVLATPRSNVKQSIGRVMRALAGKKQPVILDLLDSDSIFHGFFQSRLKQYYEVGAELVRVA